MKGELRPGGLAFVYGLRESAEHNGKLVECVRLMNPQDSVRINGKLIRYAECDGIPAWLATHKTFMDGVGFFAQSNLMPINDPGETQETETTKKTGIPA